MLKVAPKVQMQDWTNPRTGEVMQVPVGVHPSFAYNPGMNRAQKLEQVVLDKFANLSAEMAQAVVKTGMVRRSGAKELVGQDDWESLGLKSLHDGKISPAPDLLQTAIDDTQAIATMRRAIGVEPAGSVEIDTPVGRIILRDSQIPHVVEKRPDARERYANFIRPTLEQPTEVWQTAYDDGTNRRRYIKLFEGSKYDVAVIVMMDDGGNVFWNMIPRNKKDMNKLRVGQLIYKGEGV